MFSWFIDSTSPNHWIQQFLEEPRNGFQLSVKTAITLMKSDTEIMLSLFVNYYS